MKPLALLLAFLAGTAQAESFSVYVTNERSGDLTIIDGATDAVIGTFPVGKRPRGVQVSRDGKQIFVALSGSPRMAPGVDTERAPADKTADGIGVFDPAARRVMVRWHVGSDPEQLALSADGKLAFVANEDDASLSLVDLETGITRGKVKVSEEPEGVGVNPANGDVYVTCEEKGEIFVVNPAQQRVLAKIEIGGRPRSVAFLADGSRAYVAAEQGEFVGVLDAKAHTVLRKIDLSKGALPMGTAVSKDGKELYVTTGRANTLVVIDTAKDTVSATIPVGGRAWGIALSPDGSRLYTANGATNDVSVVDVKARKEIKRIKVGDGPWGIAVAPAL